MLTIFTVAQSLSDPHINLIQRNAIKSWLQIKPSCEIIILGDEPGLAELARELKITHIPAITKDRLGRELRSSVFEEAIKTASQPLVCFVNANIILFSDLLEATSKIKFPNFLLTGRRYDLDIEEAINFSDPIWEKQLHQKVKQEGKLHGASGPDYVVFPKNTPVQMPPIPKHVGGWNNWMIYHFKKLGFPVIDATAAVTAVHQNYKKGYPAKNVWISDLSARKKLRIAGGLSSMLTLREADFLLTARGLTRPPVWRRTLSYLARFKFWRWLLATKRWIQQYFPFTQ